MIFVVATGLFLLFRIMPGSFLDRMAAQGMGPEQLADLAEKWGLNDPIQDQYFSYLANLVTGDMGVSHSTGQPVLSLTIERILNSLILVGPAIIAGYLLGSVIGAFMGTRRGSRSEKWGIFTVTFFGAIPEFFLAILLIVVFSGWLDLLPSGGMISLQTAVALGENASLVDKWTTTSFLIHYILPFSTIMIRYLYFPSLIMRTSVIETSQQDFFYYHRITGISPLRILRHKMKHASLPVITMFPISMTRAIGGMVIVETVFNWPGIGSLLVNSVFARDIPVVQFVFFLVAVWIIIGNAIVDLAYSFIDPRITLGD